MGRGKENHWKEVTSKGKDEREGEWSYVKRWALSGEGKSLQEERFATR